jgi:hypothetical protein
MIQEGTVLPSVMIPALNGGLGKNWGPIYSPQRICEAAHSLLLAHLKVVALVQHANPPNRNKFRVSRVNLMPSPPIQRAGSVFFILVEFYTALWTSSRVASYDRGSTGTQHTVTQHPDLPCLGTRVGRSLKPIGFAGEGSEEKYLLPPSGVTEA